MNDKLTEKSEYNLIRNILQKEDPGLDMYTPNFIGENFDPLDRISFKNDLISVQHSD